VKLVKIRTGFDKYVWVNVFNIDYICRESGTTYIHMKSKAVLKAWDGVEEVVEAVKNAGLPGPPAEM